MSLKSTELLPTRENLIETLEKDILGRNKHVWQFACFCDAQQDRCSIAIDSNWGKGKTFFVKHVQMLIESFNDFRKGDLDRDRIKKVFEKYSKANGEKGFVPEVCVYYDAWEHDDDEDPILSIIHEIVRKSANEYSLEKTNGIFEIIKNLIITIADIKTGGRLERIRGSIREGEKDYLSELKEQNKIHDQVNNFFSKLLPEQGERLIIFIDELDRCRPAFAVRLLERIKHYFSNENITFVFSVNVSELQHVLKQYYGQGFDSCRYLDRFFDYRLALPEANMNRYYDEIIGINEYWRYDSICQEVIKHMGFGLREAQKYYQNARIAASKIAHTNKIHRLSGTAIEFSIIVFVPIIIGLRMSNITRYYDFIEGRDSGPLIEIIGTAVPTADFFKNLLNSPKEKFVSISTGAEGEVLLVDKLNQVYRALFTEIKQGSGTATVVGNWIFDKDILNGVIQTANFMSSFVDFGGKEV